MKATPGLSRAEIAARADLSKVPGELRDYALDVLTARDPGFLGYADNMAGLEIVWRNRDLLRSLGIFEAALLWAYCGPRTNTHHVPAYYIAEMFRIADRNRLREAGSPLPAPGPFTLFRGVAGHGPTRRLRGLSWTSDRAVAEWFVSRARLWGLKDPAVFRAVVPERHVLAHITDREESEFLVLMPPAYPVERVTA